MNHYKSPEKDERIKSKIMGWKHVALTYATMLLLVGLQAGIILLPIFSRLNEFARVAIVMLYWAMVAGVFTYITNWQIKESYDKPMRMLSSATQNVAEGDFSIYIEPMHTADKYDYIDVMFLDFNKMVAELGSIETLKNDFVSNVSHELKTPLAIIKNYSTALKKEDLSPESRAEYTDTIMEATDRLSTLITNILRLNKLENQAIESSPAPYDLCRQLTDCILQCEPVWEKKGLNIQVDMEDRAVITADESMMEIVWNNLLSNAIKFTEAGGTVSVKQSSDTHTITVAISDTGCGISQENIRRIFDKFYQGDTSHASEGNGLGLALASRVIDKANGTLVVQSEPGKGSTFTVQLEV